MLIEEIYKVCAGLCPSAYHHQPIDQIGPNLTSLLRVEIRAKVVCCSECGTIPATPPLNNQDPLFPPFRVAIHSKRIGLS